jgi:hypothetical protein
MRQSGKEKLAQMTDHQLLHNGLQESLDMAGSPDDSGFEPAVGWADPEEQLKRTVRKPVR